MYKFIQFDILAVDNLKLGKFERDSNNWYSYSYIPGSVIKGAIIWNIARSKGTVDKRLLNGDTIFYNAYPLVDGNTTIPMIQGYVGDKQEVRSKKAEVHLYHSFNEINHQNVIPYTNYEFIIYKKGSNHLKGYNPQMVENLHINKKDANISNNTQMFRYEAVKKGECFRSYIRIDEEFAQDIYNVLDEKIIYFGGSRGSGYGKCEIRNIKIVPLVNIFNSDTDIKEDLYIYFLSDAILYYNGKVNTYLPEEVLKEKLGIKGDCKFVSSFINLEKAATYNTMYHTNTICYTSVSKGSIMKYRVNEKIDPEKIRELTNNGVGIRKEDGYGQIAILGRIPDNLIISGYAKENHSKSEKIFLDDEDEKTVLSILKNIFYSRADLKTEKIVINLLNDKQKLDDNVQTQIGKLLNLFQNSIYKSEDDFKQELSSYLNHMESKRGKEVWHKLRRITFKYNNNRISEVNVQQLLLDFANEDTNLIFKEFKKIAEDGIKLGEYRYPAVAEQPDVIYHLQRNFLIKLFEQFLRIKR